MLENFAHGLVNLLQTHPHWGFALTFFVAFIESLAVIGTLVPGSVTMTAIGALVGTGVMPAGWTLLIAVSGALTGDLISYWFGKHYDQRLINMWPFTTHPQWITAGKSFFEKHGGKSVIIGRFFGPVRSFVPLIAGLLQMHPLYFFLSAVPSATLWAIAYLTPGILIGALSMELPPSLATKFILGILAALLASSLLIWLARHLAKRLWCTIDSAVNRIWQAMRARRAWHFITTPLADPREPDLHDQLMLAFGAKIALILLLIFLWNITHHGLLTGFNQPVYHLLQSIRTPFVDSIMTLFTLLGDRKCILSFAVAILGWLTWQRQWRAAAHWLALMVLVIGSALALKYGYYSPRPSPDLPDNSTSSLPSGHTIFTLAFFGFLAVLIGHELPRAQKRWCYKIALTFVLFAACSRLYLGPHWLTDIITSFLLGLVCVLIVTISYRRHLTSNIPPKKLSVAALLVLVVLWPSYSLLEYSDTVAFHQRTPTPLQLTSAAWWQHANPQIPTRRLNRLGHPAEPLNIQWQGELNNIQQLLEQQGWQSHSPHMDLSGFLERLSLQNPEQRLPLLPPLYHNRAPSLLMTKSNSDNHYTNVLFLWQADVEFTNTQLPLWIGTVKATGNVRNPHDEELAILSRKAEAVETSLIESNSQEEKLAKPRSVSSQKILQLRQREPQAR